MLTEISIRRLGRAFCEDEKSSVDDKYREQSPNSLTIVETLG